MYFLSFFFVVYKCGSHIERYAKNFSVGYWPMFLVIQLYVRFLWRHVSAPVRWGPYRVSKVLNVLAMVPTFKTEGKYVLYTEQPRRVRHKLFPFRVWGTPEENPHGHSWSQQRSRTEASEFRYRLPLPPDTWVRTSANLCKFVRSQDNVHRHAIFCWTILQFYATQMRIVRNSLLVVRVIEHQ